MSKRVLVATDGSDHASKSIDFAAEHAMKHDAEIYLVHVIPKAEIPDDLRRFIDAEFSDESAQAVYPEIVGHKIMDEAIEKVKKMGIEKVFKAVLTGDPAHEIVEFAKAKQIDTIFIGSRGLSNLKGLVMGSVANKVCHLITCTCVTIK
jgi:nucleotide-binding universal stress UspA family protein